MAGPVGGPSLATINCSCHKFGRNSSSSCLQAEELVCQLKWGPRPACQASAVVGSPHAGAAVRELDRQYQGSRGTHRACAAQCLAHTRAKAAAQSINEHHLQTGATQGATEGTVVLRELRIQSRNVYTDVQTLQQSGICCHLFTTKN